MSRDVPSALKVITSVVMASSAGTLSSSRQSRPGPSRTSRSNPPSGAGRTAPRITSAGIGDPADEPGVLLLARQLAGVQADPVDVVQLRVVAVEPDQDLVRERALHPDDLGLHAVERGQVTPGHSRQVDVVQAPVLVAAGVLQVQQMAAVVRPEKLPDAPVGVVGDDAGGSQVDAVRHADRGQPYVQDALVRRDPGQLGAVGGDARADPLGVAEQDRKRNEVGHWPIVAGPPGPGGLAD